MKNTLPGAVRALLLLTLASAAPVRAQSGPAPETPHARLLRLAGESRSKGSANAPILVYEIADFQCPFCARFAVDAFPDIDSAYIKTGKVQWVFVNLPMPSHTQAYDIGAWRELSQELGWPGIAIPERYGGAGLGMVELAIVYVLTLNVVASRDDLRLVVHSWIAAVTISSVLVAASSRR